MSESPSGHRAAILLAKFFIRHGAEGDFVTWQTKVVMRAAELPGFITSEMTPPIGANPQWRMLLRFQESPQLDAWRKSGEWHALLEEAQSLLADETSIQMEVKESGDQGAVTEMIVTKVKTEKEADYREWETKVQRAQARFPGFLGSSVQPPPPGGTGWTTFMQFATEERLDQWLKSSERQQLVQELAPLIDYTYLHRLDNVFPGWIPSDPKTGKGPAKWKSAMLVLLGLFPAVALVGKFVRPELAVTHMNTSLNFFLGNIVTVAFTTWLTMPLFVKRLGWWLFPSAGKSEAGVNALGAGLIIAVYAIEVAAFWHLF